MKMKSFKPILFVLVLVFFILVFTSIFMMSKKDSNDFQSFPPFPETPYDDVYEIEARRGEYRVLLTARKSPTVVGNYLKVENYWWREWDEEGNEEWLRYVNDYYYILYPIGDIAIKVIHISDEDNTAHIVEFGYR